MVCKCGHSANNHDYNKDFRVRDRCQGEHLIKNGKNVYIPCKVNCREFSKYE